MKPSNQTAPSAPLTLLALFSVLFCGAIFGFFYAWVCSTMWGLDTAEPAVAIAATKAMNASVRNAVFFPAFFLTPLVLVATAFVAGKQRRRVSARFFAGAAAVYFAGGLVVTMAVNVPMNEALALIALPQSADEAMRIWQDYSAPWQVWNSFRTIASGIALLLAGYAVLRLGNGAT